MSMKTFTQIGTGIGDLVQEKSTAYGDSLAVTGDFLRLLFPAGVPPDRLDDAFLQARIFDKQMRVANDKDAFGESPFEDMAGYCIRGIQLHQQRKDSTKWQGSANGPDAKQTPKERPASAAPLTSATTTTNASATTASAPSPRRVSSCARPTAAIASTATEPAKQNVGDRRNNLIHTYERWNYRDNVLKCAACEFENLSFRGWEFFAVRGSLGIITLRTCSVSCKNFCIRELRNGKVEGALLP
jgi:hypothetical protein